jgi:hypothetical protein
MQPIAPSGTLDLLEQFHARLDCHFAALHASRVPLGEGAPLFALEHDLPAPELELLEATVRAAVAQGFTVTHRKWWLPFAVYAAESGYTYSGNEYWQTFADRTPLWDRFGDRYRIRSFYKRFAGRYGGVVPRGAFAENFTIIAWPIANAVMPTSLQRDLARLLHEFGSALTSELLANPADLGARLAARSGAYTEQFRIFCSNVTLLGSVAAALLSREGDDSPYLVPSTLSRIVDSLSVEQSSREWLESARRAANQVRARGFLQPPGSSPRATQVRRLAATTDPRLTLRYQDGTWRAFAAFPDLSVLSSENAAVNNELRIRRARVDGAERALLPRGWLMSPGLDIRLQRWPSTDIPFLQLEDGPDDVNALLATRCLLSAGRSWLFLHRKTGSLVEIKGKVVRPGTSYLLVVAGDVAQPTADWIEEAPAEIAKARLLTLAIPNQLKEVDLQLLGVLGLSVIFGVSLRPVGLVASAWDGEGGLEWPIGDPGILAIGTDLKPKSCVITLDGQQHRIDWPPGEHERYVVLNDLAIGTHELKIILLGDEARPIVQEAILVTIRDPQVRPDIASPGEGIRLLASPAWPSLSELFFGRAVLTIDGPSGTAADLALSLRSDSGGSLKEATFPVALPLRADQWPAVAEKVRRSFERQYDEAESLRLTVSRSGIGFASLTCDRGFKPLRWRVTHQHDGSYVARLIDRTGRASTRIELFTVEQPLDPARCDADAVIVLPALGGLLRATSGDTQAATLLPTQPTSVFYSGPLKPKLGSNGRNPKELIEAAAMWKDADLPGDPFARSQRDRVLEAITSRLVSTMAGTQWSNLERQLAEAENHIDYLDAMRKGVGLDPLHRAVATAIASHLGEWSAPGPMLGGFSDVISPALARGTLHSQPHAAKFLLTLAGTPSQLAEWDQDELAGLLRGAAASPNLIRAARFAVLGARALKEAGYQAEGRS